MAELATVLVLVLTIFVFTAVGFFYGWHICRRKLLGDLAIEQLKRTVEEFETNGPTVPMTPARIREVADILDASAALVTTRIERDEDSPKKRSLVAILESDTVQNDLRRWANQMDADA